MIYIHVIADPTILAFRHHWGGLEPRRFQRPLEPRRFHRRREETWELGWRLSGACARVHPPAGANRSPPEINAAVFGFYFVYLVVYSQISVYSLVIWLFGYLQICSSLPPGLVVVPPLFHAPRIIENPDPSSHLRVSLTTATNCLQHRYLDQRGADRPRGCTNVSSTHRAEVRCIVQYGAFSKVIFGL